MSMKWVGSCYHLPYRSYESSPDIIICSGTGNTVTAAVENKSNLLTNQNGVSKNE